MKSLTGALWAKTLAIFLMVACLFSLAVSAIGIAVLAKNDVYFDDGQALRNELLDQASYHYRSQLYPFLEALAYPDTYPLDLHTFHKLFDRDCCNFVFTVTDADGKEVLSNRQHGDTFQRTYEYDAYFEGDGYYANDYVYIEGEAVSPVYHIFAGIRKDFTAKDRIYYYVTYGEWFIGARYWLIITAILSPITFILLLVFLTASAGRHNDEPTLRLNFIDRIPLDLYIGLLFGLAFGLSYVIYEMTYITDIELIVLAVLAGPFALSLWMTVATRIKTGTLWHNTVIAYLLRLLKKGCILFGKALWKLPLYWPVAAAWAVWSFVQLVVCFMTDSAAYVLFWFFEKLLFTPLLIWVTLSMQTLRKSAAELAKGHLDLTVSTKGMLPPFKEHGENLNGIGEGMKLALEESMRSERMRAELITNVSHDIKTPLTSIINYVDLLKNDGLESEHAEEYLAVLERQSARLKKLTEDLIEASKASTGHVAVSLTPLDANILLQQAVAEYADRLQDCALTAVLDLQEAPAMIAADGRLLWRVFDNLLSNICKYAKADTRVYLSTTTHHDSVCITIKNISKEPLNISPDELTERFVRGDRSRNTEGSGLGLSIAKSLTELQSGNLQLVIDGDLFKSILTFPCTK